MICLLFLDVSDCYFSLFAGLVFEVLNSALQVMVVAQGRDNSPALGQWPRLRYV